MGHASEEEESAEDQTDMAGRRVAKAKATNAGKEVEKLGGKPPKE